MSNPTEADIGTWIRQHGALALARSIQTTIPKVDRILAGKRSRAVILDELLSMQREAAYMAGQDSGVSQMITALIHFRAADPEILRLAIGSRDTVANEYIPRAAASISQLLKRLYDETGKTFDDLERGRGKRISPVQLLASDDHEDRVLAEILVQTLVTASISRTAAPLAGLEARLQRQQDIGNLNPDRHEADIKKVRRAWAQMRRANASLSAPSNFEAHVPDAVRMRWIFGVKTTDIEAGLSP